MLLEFDIGGVIKQQSDNKTIIKIKNKKSALWFEKMYVCIILSRDITVSPVLQVPFESLRQVFQSFTEFTIRLSFFPFICYFLGTCNEFLH